MARVNTPNQKRTTVKEDCNMSSNCKTMACTMSNPHVVKKVGKSYPAHNTAK